MLTAQTTLEISDGQSLPAWFENAAAGVQISSDSGGGKSVLARQLIKPFLQSREAFVLVIDPSFDGSLADAVERDALSMGSSVRNRLHVITPGDLTSPVVPINPLYVERTPGMTDHEYEARLVVRARHMARMTAACSGLNDLMATQQLEKWLTLIYRGLGKMGLPPAESIEFTTPGTEAYEALARNVPDWIARYEFSGLLELSRRAQEEILASTKARLINFYGNPVIDTHFGVADPAQCANVAQLRRDRQIVIVNLKPMGVLAEEDQMLLANAWLSEAYFAVFNDQQAVPTLIAVDELPVLKPSYKLIEAGLRVQRKGATRLIACHQGTQCFAERENDPLLRNLVSQCGVHFYLRHIDPVDAFHYGRILVTHEWDPLKEKYRHVEMEQYQDGFDVLTLIDTSYGQSDSGSDSGSEGDTMQQQITLGHGQEEGNTLTEGDSENRATTVGNTHTEGGGEVDTQSTGRTTGTSADEDLIARAYQEAERTASSNALSKNHSDAASRSVTAGTTHSASQALKLGRSRNRTVGQSSARERSLSWARSFTRTFAQVLKQTLVPILCWREVVRSIVHFTFDEQVAQFAQWITRFSAGEAFLYIAGRGVDRVRVPLPEEPYAGAPKALGRARQALREALLQRPMYHTVESVVAYRELLLPAFLDRVAMLSHRSQQPVALLGHERSADSLESLSEKELESVYEHPFPYDF